MGHQEGGGREEGETGAQEGNGEVGERGGEKEAAATMEIHM